MDYSITLYGTANSRFCAVALMGDSRILNEIHLDTNKIRLISNFEPHSNLFDASGQKWHTLITQGQPSEKDEEVLKKVTRFLSLLSQNKLGLFGRNSPKEVLSFAQVAVWFSWIKVMYQYSVRITT